MEKGKVNITLAELAEMPVLTLCNNEKVKANFIFNYLQHIENDQEQAEAFHAAESNYFIRRLMDVPDMLKCSQFSIYCAFNDVVLNNLTFNPDANLVYLQSRNANIGTYKNPVYEKRAKFVISPYGELVIRMNAGQIKYADDPVIVYEGDFWKMKTNEQGSKVVLWESEIPRKSQKIIGAFVKITRADGSSLFPFFLQEDIDRLAGYSLKNARGENPKANALYSSGVNGQVDTGFLAAKILKHAFKTFPKVKTRGTTASFEDDNTDLEMTQILKEQFGDQETADLTKKPAASPAPAAATFGEEPAPGPAQKAEPQTVTFDDPTF